MIALDVNVLLAAHRADHPHHDALRAWLDDLVSRREPFTVPAFVWSSFIRIATNRRIFTIPTPVPDAFAFLRAIRAQPQHLALESGERQVELFEQLCLETESSGDLTVDAFLAAFALEHGAAVASLDRDFARFPGLDWLRPGD